MSSQYRKILKSLRLLVLLYYYHFKKKLNKNKGGELLMKLPKPYESRDEVRVRTGLIKCIEFPHLQFFKKKTR